jgi:Resolvase, N terminal domain
MRSWPMTDWDHSSIHTRWHECGGMNAQVTPIPPYRLGRIPYPSSPVKIIIRPGRCACCHAAGSAGQVNARPAQRDRGCRTWRRLQEPQGCLSRYHERPRSGLMLTVLGGLAEFERELIRARTGEGRKRAKERGSGEGLKLPAEVFPYQQTWQDTVVDARQ